MKKGKWLFNKRTLSNILVVLVGVAFYLLLSNFSAVFERVSWVLSVFAPFFNGIAIAYLVNMPMRFFERTIFKKLRFRRVLAVLLAYLLAVLLLALLLGLVVPQIVQSVLSVVRNLPAYLQNLGDLAAWLTETFGIAPKTLDFFVISYTDLMTTIAAWARSFLPNLLNITFSIGSGVVGALTAFMASIYMLASKEKLLRQCKRVLYAVFPVKPAQNFINVCKLSNSMFSGFISGKIIDSAIIGAICYVFMLVTQMPFAVLISIIVAITNIIPFFGPFIGAIPSAMLLLLVDPVRALWFIVFIILLQQFDGNILGPKILGNSTGLPALWVLIAIVAGGGLFGFAGMVLGVPTVAVLYTLGSNFVESRLKRKNVDENGQPMSSAEPDTPDLANCDTGDTGAPNPLHDEDHNQGD